MRPTRSAIVLAVLSCAAALACSSTGSRRGPSSAARPSGATITATKKLSDRVVDLTVTSPALKAITFVRVVLPYDFAARPQHRWPVLYLLHGCCDAYTSWSRSTDVVKFFESRNVLVVMPDGGNVGFYSDWSPGPHWETYHVKELPALLAKRYRAGPVRAIAGLSMGGLGAVDYTARHPGMFRAAASFSGVVDTRLDASVSSGYQVLVRSYGEDPNALWGDPTKNAARWKAHNPADLVDQLGDTPVFVSSGSGTPGPLDTTVTVTDPTERSIHAQNRIFARRLKSHDPRAHIDLYGPGTHDWPYWEREFHRAWPMLAAALGVPA